MEPLATQTQPESLMTQLARKLLALHVAKTKQQELYTLDPATASPATAPPVVGECIKQTAAKQSTKPWLPSGSPSSAWGRTKAKTESGIAISPALNSSRGRSAHTCEWASAPGGTAKQVITDQHSNDSSKSRACRAFSSPGQSPNPGRASRSPAKSISPRQHSTAGNSPSTPKYSTMATRSSSSPGRALSPLRGSSTAGRLDTSTARLDSTAGSMSAGGSPFDSISGCAGPGRLPYHEVLQIAYGPPAPSILKTHLDLAAVSSKADPTKQRRVSSTSTGAGATPRPQLPSRDSSRKVTRQTQQEVDDGSTNPGTTAAAAAMGPAVAAATAAAALLTRRSTQDQTRTPSDSALPGTHSTSQELLKGYTTGYIDGRLAALRGPSKDGSASPPVSSTQGAPARPRSSSSSRSSSLRQAATPAVDYTGQNPDSFFLRSHDSLSPAQQPLRVPAAAAAPAPEEHRPTIRPELVKQIAMKIVSAALASPDKAIVASTASAPLTAAVPDAGPVGPKAAAQALLQANPGQLRNLLEQMQKVLPPQRQQSTELSAVLPSPHALLQQQQHQQQQHQQLQMQQQLLHWREDLTGGLPEYSVSAFDRETDAYLIPVSHIGCQTSEVFSDRPHSTRAQPADQAPEAAASTTAAALAQTVLRATAAVVAGPTVPADCSTAQAARIAEWQLAAQAAAGAAVSPAAPSSDRADGRLLLVCDAPSSGFVSVQHQQQHTPGVDELMQTDAVCEEEQQLQPLCWQAPSTASSLSLSPSLLVPPSPQQQQQQDVLPPQQQTSCAGSQQEQEHGDQQAQQQQQVCFPAAEEQPAGQAVAGQRQEQPTQPQASPDVDVSTVSQDKASRSSLARIEELLRAMHSKAFSPQPQQPQQQQQQPVVQPVVVQHHSQPALESRSSLSINLDMPLSPTGTGSLVGLQVLERLLSELHVLQSAVKRHAAVDQLELSRLDALMAQVALLNHWLVDRAGTAHPVSAQLALLQQDLQAWRSRVGPDVNLQPSGPHSTGSNTLQPSPRSPRNMQPASVSPVPLQQQHSPRGVQQLQTAWQATAASGGTPSPRAAQGLQGVEALPEQQLLQPILSGGLIRARNTGSMPGSWPVGLPPVQEGRESECDTASSIGEVASVHSLPPSRGPSIGGRSSGGAGSSSSSKGRSILASVGSSSGCARGEGGPIFQEVPLMPEPQRPAQQQQQQREKPSEGLSFLKPSGWLSPRGRGSVDQPRSPTSASSRKSVDVQRSRTPSPKKPVLATRSMDGGVADAAGRLPRGGSVPLSNRSSSGGGSGSPSSAEKKRGFMLALKQTLQENMQQLGGRRELARGSSLRREGSQVDARRLTNEALSRVGQ